MLLRFKFSNFRSFRGEQEFSLIAGSFRDPDNGAFSIPGLSERVRPVAAIYGANGSGKTNVLRALQFLTDAVQKSHRLWAPDQAIPRDPFMGDTNSPAPSRFVIDFVLREVRHQYGFVMDSKVVAEEWLHAYPRNKKQTWFNRKLGRPIVFGSKLSGENKTIAQLTRSNSLFLSAAAQNNHEMLLPVYNWFSNRLRFVIGDRGDWKKLTTKMCNDSRTRSLITQLLFIGDLGIVDLQVSEERIPEEMREKARKLIDAMRLIFEYKGDMASVDELGAQSVVKLIHKVGGETFPFGPEQESAGTIAYLALLGPLVEAIKNGGVICIDELDASLHPLISIQIMQLFANRNRNPKAAQMIFNTHDTNLLGGAILRRDEVWFTEKDSHGESHLYPLTDFKPRRQESLQNGYLQGRYGAIPFIHAEQLMTELVEGDAEKA